MFDVIIENYSDNNTEWIDLPIKLKEGMYFVLNRNKLTYSNQDVLDNLFTISKQEGNIVISNEELYSLYKEYFFGNLTYNYSNRLGKADDSINMYMTSVKPEILFTWDKDVKMPKISKVKSLTGTNNLNQLMSLKLDFLEKDVLDVSDEKNLVWLNSEKREQELIELREFLKKVNLKKLESYLKKELVKDNKVSYDKNIYFIIVGDDNENIIKERWLANDCFSKASKQPKTMYIDDDEGYKTYPINQSTFHTGKKFLWNGLSDKAFFDEIAPRERINTAFFINYLRHYFSVFSNFSAKQKQNPKFKLVLFNYSKEINNSLESGLLFELENNTSGINIKNMYNYAPNLEDYELFSYMKEETMFNPYRHKEGLYKIKTVKELITEINYLFYTNNLWKTNASLDIKLIGILNERKKLWTEYLNTEDKTILKKWLTKFYKEDLENLYQTYYKNGLFDKSSLYLTKDTFKNIRNFLSSMDNVYGLGYNILSKEDEKSFETMLKDRGLSIETDKQFYYGMGKILNKIIREKESVLSRLAVYQLNGLAFFDVKHLWNTYSYLFKYTEEVEYLLKVMEKYKVKNKKNNENTLNLFLSLV